MRLLAETFRIHSLTLTLPARAAFYLWEIILTSAIVQLGLALPMVVYFHRIGVSGLSANAAIVPIMGLVVPLGFVAIFTGWAWIAAIAGSLLGAAQAIVNFHAAIEPMWRIPTPPLWLAIALSLALLAAAIANTGRARLGAGVAVVAALALVLWHPFAPGLHAGELELTAIDVGQGDSLFVAFPDGRTMLMDGGGVPVFGRTQRSNLDTGEDVVAPYLWDRGIRRVDIIALSHAHEDHIGGLPALISDFHPRELWTGATPESAAWSRVRGAARTAGTTIRPMHSPERFSLGGVNVETLAPMPDYIPDDHPGNNDSLVLRLTWRDRSFLLSGDVERPIENAMLNAGEIHTADVLKVAHHGSRTSSTEEFLDAVHPAFALISAGFENSYGHPHRVIIDRLERRHTEVLRTDRDGLITIRTDGHRIEVDTYSGFLNQR
jgi:competence protein ComEC